MFHETVGGHEIEFDLEDESDDTKNLILKLMLIVYTLRSGCTIIIDGLNDDLHPLIIAELVRMFKSKRLNPKEAQLICAVQIQSS